MIGKTDMYLENASVEINVLRQGDIVSGLHLLGAISLQAIQYNTDYQGKRLGWQLPSPPKLGDAIVLSHSCELDPSNTVKITSIILCPIRDINTATDKGKIEELINTNLVAQNEGATYLKYFYLEPNTKLEFKNGAVADFSKLFSVRKSCYESVLHQKILQLKPEIAEALALKLALYFHR